METVEVVVRIPKEKYKLLTEMGDCVLNHNERAIKHGTVLPKGHGRLIDADKYRKEFLDSRAFEPFKILDMQTTVIEADKEGD